MPKLIATVLLASLTSTLYAKPLICSQIKNLDDLYSYIQEQHPDMRYLNDIAKNNHYLVDIAKQRPNPQVNLQYDTRDDDTQRVHNTEVSILHTFELGGKRKARIKLAEKQKSISEIQTRERLENIYVDILLSFFEYQHHKYLISNYEEAILVFKKVTKIKETRDFLSPEDKAQLVAIRVATRDYEIKSKNLLSKNQQIQLKMNYIFNSQCDLGKLGLKGSIHKILDMGFSGKTSKSYSQVTKFQKQIELAQANADVQNSLAYSNLQIGPFMTLNNQNQGDEFSAGIAFSVALPIYHRNQAAIAKAKKMIEISTNYQNQILLKVQNEVLKWKTQYDNAKENLENSISESELRKNYKEMKKLFKRGIVSASSIIEVYRQIVEYDLNKHQEEERMLEAILWLKVIDGTLLSRGDQK